MGGRVVPGMLVAVAVISGAGAVVIRPAVHGPAPAPKPLADPVLSPRRLPAALSRVVADARLGERLDAALADPTLGRAATESCMEVDLAGQAIYLHRPATALLPASNLKLLTALAALTRLGPDARFTTEVRAARPPAGGVVNGPLWLVGGGDPLLATAAYRPSQHEWTWSREPASLLESLADRIKAAGVRTITGGVVGDDSRYDRQRAVPTWKPSYLADGEIGAVGALVVDGGFLSLTRHAPAPYPAVTAAAALTTLLRQRGIQVAGSPSEGLAPAGGTRVAALDSLPLSQIVAVMLRESDNLSAEMLVKELGRRFGGAGTWPAGLAVVRDTLASAGLPLAGLELVDGSGLDRSDRSDCDLLVKAIDGSTPPEVAVTAGLPIAGRDGTLVERMLGSPAAGRLRAKTGSLTGVAALTGFIEPPAGSSAEVAATPAFALLANDLPTDAVGRGLEDRIAVILAAYPEAPAPDSLAPPGS